MINFNLFGEPYFLKTEQFRIPYMGSKRTISEELFQKMLEIKPNAKYFFDLFGGGGAMSFLAIQLGLKTHYNEKQKGMVDFLNYILKRAIKGEKGQYGIFPDDFYKFITKEEFSVLKNEDSIKGQFARICYSFGNNQKGYAFGDIEEWKHLAHDIVVFRNKDDLAEFNKKNNSNFLLSEKNTWNERRLDFMAQVSKKQPLQQLERLEQLPDFTLTNLDFQDVKIDTPIEETIIYLDPPYRGTTEYKESALVKDIDNYFRNSPYTCFMSEYSAPFDSILEIRKISLLRNDSVKRKYVIEKLFCNKKLEIRRAHHAR